MFPLQNSMSQASSPVSLLLPWLMRSQSEKSKEVGIDVVLRSPNSSSTSQMSQPQIMLSLINTDDKVQQKSLDNPLDCEYQGIQKMTSTSRVSTQCEENIGFGSYTNQQAFIKNFMLDSANSSCFMQMQQMAMDNNSLNQDGDGSLADYYCYTDINYHNEALPQQCSDFQLHPNPHILIEESSSQISNDSICYNSSSNISISKNRDSSQILIKSTLEAEEEMQAIWGSKSIKDRTEQNQNNIQNDQVKADKSLQESSIKRPQVRKAQITVNQENQKKDLEVTSVPIERPSNPMAKLHSSHEQTGDQIWNSAPQMMTYYFPQQQYYCPPMQYEVNQSFNEEGLLYQDFHQQLGSVNYLYGYPFANPVHQQIED